MGDISLEDVLQFMVANGGRVENRKLVIHFKDFLSHAVNKETNKEKFRNYVSELAVVKVENGEKILELKKHYRQSLETPPPSPKSPINDSPSTHSGLSDAGGKDNDMDIDRTDGGMVSKARIDEAMDVKLRGSNRAIPQTKTGQENTSLKNGTGSTGSLTSTSSQKSASMISVEKDSDDSVTSVKDKIKNLNRNISDSDMSRTRPSGQGAGNKKSYKHTGDDENSDAYMPLDAEQKDWLVVCSSADYHDMNKLLNKNPGLVKLKDVTNTALHWAAKSGKSDVVKLLAARPGMRINQRSGYTALHLAAIHGHQHILELLVQTYKADINVRDFSGKKPKQYLKNSASSKAQIVMTLTDSFSRSSMRKSSRNKGVSSLLQSVSSAAKQPLLNFSAFTESMADETDSGQKILANSAAASLYSNMEQPTQDENMPPEAAESLVESPKLKDSPGLRSANEEN